MYALINTMSGNDLTIGRVVSAHYTAEAAERADRQLQRLTRQSSGSNSYLPTAIVRLDRRVRAGEYIERREV